MLFKHKNVQSISPTEADISICQVSYTSAKFFLPGDICKYTNQAKSLKSWLLMLSQFRIFEKVSGIKSMGIKIK